MDIKVGKLRINLSALALYEHGDNPELSRYISNRTAPRPLYNWSCKTQLGDRPRGPVFRQETIIKFLVTNRGVADNQLSTALQDETVKASDLNTIQAFDRELQNQLKPLEVSVDWNQLWLPYKDDYSLRIMYQVFFLYCVGRPYGMDISDYFYIMVPSHVSFATVITGSCGGPLKPGTVITGMSARRMGARRSERIETLERQITEEENEAEEARRRRMQEMMLEWGWSPTHEGGLFDDDEEPEEPEENGEDEDEEDH